MKCRACVGIEACIEINFVDQYVRSMRVCELTDLAQLRIGRSRARRIVKVAENDDPGLRLDGAFNIARVNLKSILDSPWKTANPSAKIFGSRDHRLVCRLLDQYFVSGLDQRGHREMVGHGCAIRRDDAFGPDAILAREALL